MNTSLLLQVGAAEQTDGHVRRWEEQEGETAGETRRESAAATAAAATAGREDGGLRSPSTIDRQRTWDLMNSVAFWASIFFIQGAVLFTVGSVCLYPGVVPRHAPDYVGVAWVDYTFMIGAWCFSVGNYLVYFQVINAQDNGPTIRWLSCPRRESGHLGALCNCVGSVLFNLNTMTMFAPRLKDSDGGFNFWYVFTGAAGSVCFVVGATFEGEHNDWRHTTCRRWTELPFLMSVLNFVGGTLFAVAYLVDVDRSADALCEQGECLLTIHGVAGTFTVGSIFFIISSWMSLWMWKSQNFGLSFGKTVVGHAPAVKVDLKQQCILVVYVSNLCMAWIKLGFLLANAGAWDNPFEVFHDTVLKLLTYFCIMFLASALHTTPRKVPYNYVFWMMRVISVYGFVGEAYAVHRLAVDWQVRPGNATA